MKQLIPAPDKPVSKIAWETMEEPVTRTTNYYWTEITFAMLIGHYFGTRFGYLHLVLMGAMGIGLNILLNIIQENLSAGIRENSSGVDK